jgi:hypothetical protein
MENEMTKINTGGPALPNIARDMNEGEPLRWTDGMSLRDYMAIHDKGMHADDHANYAAACNSDPIPKAGDNLDWAKWLAKADARLRYIRADAMIAARDEGDKP